MTTDIPGTYCQNCFTWNPGERESCRKCGTRLLIVGGDQVWDDEAETDADEDLDEHLLERITGLEENFRRIETYLEAISDQLGRLERSEVMLRNGLMSLVQEMEHKGQLDGQAFSARWEDLVEENLQLLGARELFSRYRARILPIAKPKSINQLRRALLETSTLLDIAKLPEAAARLEQALGLDPKNYELIFTVAALKEVIQDLDEAEILARKVVQLSPRHYEGWMLLAKLFREEPQRADQAIEALHKAAELRPDELEPRTQLCEILLDEEDLQGAQESALEALKLQRDGHTLALMGEVLLARGEATQAIAILKEASGFLPGEPFVRELLAESYLVADERPKAFAILEELLRQNPGDHELLLLLDAETPAQLRSARGGSAASRLALDDLEALIRENALDEAAAQLKRVLRKERSERAEFLELQIALLKQPEANLAQVAAFMTSKRHPRLCFLALRLALDYLMEHNQNQQVLDMLEAYLSAHPKCSGAWEAAIIRQAYRLIIGQITDEDRKEVRRLQANPLPGQEGRARTLLGQYLLDLNQPQEVVDLIAPVLKNEPTLINHFQLGTALAALHREHEALDVLESGMDADPRDLQESQAAMMRIKMKALIHELDPEHA